MELGRLSPKACCKLFFLSVKRHSTTAFIDPYTTKEHGNPTGNMNQAHEKLMHKNKTNTIHEDT